MMNFPYCVSYSSLPNLHHHDLALIDYSILETLAWDPTSVVDRYHRSHDIPNLFICDGSSFVTSGRGQPTMTIMALAFRAAEHMMEAARKNEI